MKKIENFIHEWHFDLPWHMVYLRDWFYMVNMGYIGPIRFLHVRVLGIRSTWEFFDKPSVQRIWGRLVRFKSCWRLYPKPLTQAVGRLCPGEQHDKYA